MVHVYMGLVGIEYRVPDSIDVKTFKNDLCICGTSGYRLPSPSQHRYLCICGSGGHIIQSPSQHRYYKTQKWFMYMWGRWT